jgi:predicted Ser/Thr protein kinase
MSEGDASQKMENKCPKCGGPLPSGVLAGLCPACLFKQGVAIDTGAPPEVVAFQPPSVEEVARLFPQLEILGFIGKGGMGAVYKARQPALDRIVALKILPPSTAAGSGFIERFNREARALAKLTHANIVTVHEFGQVNGLPFFIMEFVDGMNLRELEQAGKLSPRQALQIVPQICEALQFAHDEGIVHRDIKPENILLDKRGRVKIADFGIAKILGGAPDVAITETKGAIGTPHYMAPEQMEKPTTVDHRADIFSLGVVFYEMLTGELPLGKFATPSSCKMEVDVRLDDVVLRALEKDPERRYQHASQVKTAVDTIASTAAPVPPASGDALAKELLARASALSIRSCLRRAWALVLGDFWPIFGVNALIYSLWAIANSSGAPFSWRNEKNLAIGSVLSLLVNGPLMGGLYLFLLKKIRGETATVETAFSGFSPRFLHLFLASFVSFALTGLGFICLIVPGIYLLVAWSFAVPLVIDKGIHFWSAMELSRKIASRHWWKLLIFVIFLFLLKLAGLVVLIMGFLFVAPFAQAALMYAYEDLFGGTTQGAGPAPAGLGPFGTEVRPGIPAKPPVARKLARKWLAPMLTLIAAIIIAIVVVAHERRMQENRAIEAEQAATVPNPPESPVPGEKAGNSHDTLAERLEAASVITDVAARDKSLAAIVTDAANAGEVNLVNDSVGRISDITKQTQSKHDAALSLSKHGLRKQAIEIAKSIWDVDVRDQTLSELAQ